MDINEKEEINNVLREVETTYQLWLKESDLSEAGFLAFRTVQKFKMEKRDYNGQAQIFMTYVEEGEINCIGTPVLSPSAEDNETFYDNACILFIYIAGKLDKENKEHPINGSYCNDYFGERVRKFFRRIIPSENQNLELSKIEVMRLLYLSNY